MGLTPKFPAFLRTIWVRMSNHAEPMHRFFRFFLAQDNFALEIPPGLGCVGLHVVSSDTCSRPNELAHQYSIHRIIWKTPNERNDSFAEFGRPLTQIVLVTAFDLWILSLL